MPQTDVRIVMTRHEYVTRERDPKDSWDRDCTGASLDVQGITTVVPPQHYSDLTVDFDVLPDTDYYLVWADYGTGDSFGNDDNQFEAIDLFSSVRAASVCRSKLIKAGEDGGFSATYLRENGQSVTTSVAWAGYFEHLNELHIQTVRIIPI